MNGLNTTHERRLPELYHFTMEASENVISIMGFKKNLQHKTQMSHVMGKTRFCLCENKGADRLYSNCTAGQWHCFCYTDCTTPLLLISKISSFQLSSILQAGLC